MAPAKKKQRLSDGTTKTPEHLEIEQEKVAVGENGSINKEEKAGQAKRSLFVRSLPSSTTTESLTLLFSNSYPVKHATAITDPATGECRGYGFVTFADAEDTVRAKDEFNGHLLDGKKLRVEIAEPRQRNADGTKEDKTEPEKKEVQQPPKLIVRNLPWSIKGSEQLTKLFMSYGKVKQAYVPKKGPGLMAGFGFVIMRGKKNAEKAIEGVNGKVVDGRTLAVDWAVDKAVYEDIQEDETHDKDEVGSDADHGERDQGSEDDEDNEEDEDMGPSDGEDEDMGPSDGEEEGTDGDGEEGEDRNEAMDEAIEDDPKNREEDKSHTMFVRNLPFTCTDEDLEDHFSQFGSTRYARVVMDYATERSRGTGFVCFYDKEDAANCLRNAPRRPVAEAHEKAGKKDKPSQTLHSILQNDATDPSGQYTLDGRVLQVTAAVEKTEANRLMAEGTAHRSRRDNDKRRLYLLSEGTISSKSKLWDELSPSEKAMRESSAKQRKSLIESNPTLHLSLTRLSIRNIPRSVTSKELKALARDAIVGFASDAKNGVRERLSKEEVARGGEEMQAAELARKRAGKGVVKQATVVFEGASGTKIHEDAGAGRSRGYGFIEYYTHRNALMGLRWLNGHAIGYQVKEGNAKASREDIQERKKRLIVEFAIENAQVVQRRKDREDKARNRSQTAKDGQLAENEKPRGRFEAGDKSRKRKRGLEPRDLKKAGKKTYGEPVDQVKQPIDEALAKRNQIIGRKRAARKARKG